MPRKIGKEVLSVKEMEALMKTDAAAVTANLAVMGSSYITIGLDKTFSYKDTKIGTSVDLIIMGFTHVNTYYAHAFDSKNPVAPNCWAISDSGVQMQPGPTAPERQSETCEACPQNVFGSADGREGGAKACKNTYRLAVLDHTDPEQAEMAIISVPPTSMKVLNKYLRGLEVVKGRPPWGVVTHFSFEEASKYPTLQLKMQALIDHPKLYAALRERLPEAMRMINEPFDSGSYLPAPKSRGKKSKSRAPKSPKRKGRSKY